MSLVSRIGAVAVLVLVAVFFHGCAFLSGSTRRPVLAVAPGHLDFGTSANELLLTVSNTGTRHLHWTVATVSHSPWLSIDPLSGSIPAGGSTLVTAAVTRTRLSEGTYTTTFRVSSDGGDVDVPVSMTVAGSSPITLALQVESIDGLVVTVNGYVGTTAGTVQRLNWEWGDGTSVDSWFPASHTYAAQGTYTITVTAFCSTGHLLSKSISVAVRDLRSGQPRVSLDQASYARGDTVVITVIDERYTAAPAISGTGKVLVLSDRNSAEVASWTTIPVLPGTAAGFRVSFVLPPNVTEGSITATYTDPAVPTRRASAVSTINSQAQRFSPPYIVFPPNLHLTPGETSAVPLRVIDRHGKTVTGVLLFSNFDASLISISQDGYVTALRAESATEIGTWVVAHANGVLAESTCVVRVLSRSPETDFIWVAGQNTALYYPATVRGEDIVQYVDLYEILRANEYAYRVQHELMGIQPFGGARQVFEVDFGETEAQSVCGISGNPIRLGWYLAGHAWQNCFLFHLPHVPSRSPQWGVFYHELGHNFTWASSTFARALGELPHYSEGIATALGLTTIARIAEDQAAYPLSPTTVASLRDLLERDERFFLDGLARWLAGGAHFGDVDANIVDGIWLEHSRQRPGDFAARFFRPLQPRYSSQVTPVLSQKRPGEEHTLFAALVSAAAGSDLSSIFMDSYNYPINMPLFRAAYEIFTRIADG